MLKLLLVKTFFCNFAAEINTKMKKTAYLLFSVLLLFSSCHQSDLKTQLIEIDSIALSKGDELALEMLDNIPPETIDDEECLAYYWLLKIRTEIRLGKDIKSATPLEIPIKYYTKHADKGKLARAYGYKGYILEQSGDLKQTTISLKEAEKLVKDEKSEIDLLFNIYHTLSVINSNLKEKQLALKYSKLALNTAYQSGTKYNIAYALMSMNIAYNLLNMEDSAQYYTEKYIQYISEVPENQRSAFYANIGGDLVDRDQKRAELYLDSAISISPNLFAYRSLARLYFIQGDHEKAKAMWAKALQTDNLYLKSNVMEAMYECQRDEGDYQRASETAMQLVALKDSIAKNEKEADIRRLQEKFEEEQQVAAARRAYQTYLALAALLLLVALGAAVYLYRSGRKDRSALRQTREALEKYRAQLKQAEAASKGDSREVERLTRCISDLQARQSALLQNGRERYEEILAGGNTLKWSRNDFSDCIEYYRTLDASFVARMETDYEHLSAKYIFFALLEHLGKSDEELQRIMVISQNTVRANRSRISSKRKASAG